MNGSVKLSGGGLGTSTAGGNLPLPGRAYTSVRKLKTPLSPMQNSTLSEHDDTSSLCSRSIRANTQNTTQLKQDSNGYLKIPEDNSYWETVKTSSTESLRLKRLSHLCRGILQSRYLARQNEEPDMQLNHQFFTRGRWSSLGLSGTPANKTSGNVSKEREDFSVVNLFENADDVCHNEASKGFRRTSKFHEKGYIDSETKLRQ